MLPTTNKPRPEQESSGSVKTDLEISVGELQDQMKEVQKQLERLDALERIEKVMGYVNFKPLESASESMAAHAGIVPDETPVAQREGKVIMEDSTTVFGNASRQLGYSPAPPSAWIPPDDRVVPLSKRLELLIFNEEQAENWISRVEQYFNVMDFTDGQKLHEVHLYFSGEALNWYQWEKDRRPFVNWDQFKRRVIEDFVGDEEICVGQRLLTLRQEGTVKEYCRDFIGLATNAPEVPEFVLEWTFMNGLKSEIRTRAETFAPRTLTAMMSTAKKVASWTEAEGFAPRSYGDGPNKGNRVGPTKPPGPTSLNGFRPQNKPTTTFVPTKSTNTQRIDDRNLNRQNRVKPPFRRLTQAEIDWR